MTSTRSRVAELERQVVAFLARKRANADYSRYANDPVAFAHDVLGEVTWEAQDYIMRALLEHKRVSIRAGRKCSKTHTIGELVCWMMYTAPTIAITTGSGGRQVKEFLWSRIRSMHAKGKLPGQCDTTAIRISPDRYALGFSTDDPDTVQGFHAGVQPPGVDVTATRLFVVIDEAPGVSQAVYDAMEGSLSGENVYLLVCGNPTLPADSPHFYARSHRADSDFHRIHISLLPDVECAGADKCFHGVPDWLRDDKAIARRAKNHGKDSPLFRAHVEGEFSAQGADEMRVIPFALLQSAESRAGTSPQGRHMGVDVARSEGGDESVAALWVDGVKVDQRTWRLSDLMQLANEIAGLHRTWEVPGHNIHVDKVGLGAGALDRLTQMGVHVDGVDFGSGAADDWRELTGETIFKNRRAELHWVFRRALEEGKGHLPAKWEDSRQQSQWARYVLKQEGSRGTQILIEPKEDIRSRQGRSPDHFDADLLAWSRTSSQAPRVIFRARR